MRHKQTILSTSYLPSIQYFQSLNKHASTYIEHKEYYTRHSIRNRTWILGANNPILLTVPITKKHYSKTLIEDIKISNTKWTRNHLNSIRSAYGSAPFFIHYFDQLENIINKNHVFLIDLNYDLLNYFLEELSITKEIRKTENYIKSYCNDTLDQRLNIQNTTNFKKYTQVFSNTFIPNLSIIDLIFNLGTDAKEYIDG